jgi:flagellar biosynthesis/type III secretory pathway protein FliH
VNPALIGIGALLAALVIGWLIVAVVRRIRRGHRYRVKQRRLAKLRRAHAEDPTRGPSEAAVIRDAERSLAEARREASAIVTEAERKANEIAAAAESAREALLADARQSAGRAAGEIKTDAKRTASAIVREAEDRAETIVAAAELARAELEREMTRERQLADEKRRELSTLLVNLLGEVQRASTAGSTNVRTLGDLRETRRRADSGV